MKHSVCSFIVRESSTPLSYITQLLLKALDRLVVRTTLRISDEISRNDTELFHAHGQASTTAGLLLAASLAANTERAYSATSIVEAV